MAGELQPQGHAQHESESSVLDTLSAKEKLFCQYMALYDNVLKSGRLAKYGKTADDTSGVFRLMHLDRIKAGIAYYRELFAAQSHTTPEKILYDLAQMANLDITDVFTEEWNLKPKSEWGAAARKALVGMKVTRTKSGFTLEPRFAKLEALVALARLFGMGNAQRPGESEAGTHLHVHLAGREHLPGERQRPAPLQVGPVVVHPPDEENDRSDSP